MNTNGRTTLAVLAMLATISNAGAGNDHATHRQHGAHVHGHGTLQVAVDGPRLVIELTVPADNVVGFEHAPSDDAQREKVRAALATFRDGAALFEPSASAGCAIESSEASLAGMEEGAAKSEGGDHGHGHDHDKDHAHGHDKEHDHSSDSHSLEEGHAELRSRYVYRCADAAALVGVEVRLFEHLLDVEELDAQVVTPSLQAATALRAGSAMLMLVR